MPLIQLFSAAFTGLNALPVEIEVDLSQAQMTNLRIVGLPDAAVKESKDRVLHAIKNNGFSVDTLNATVHLAPAEIKKVGAFYDLPIAIGILHALGVFKLEPSDYLIAGELSLAGQLRPIAGTLSLALLAKKLGKKGVVIPQANLPEAHFFKDLEVIAIYDLKEVIQFFKSGTYQKKSIPEFQFTHCFSPFDMAQVKGQAFAKRALEVAATGRHNFLLSGPPGTGKTMLAKAFTGILPPLNFEEALEVSQIHSLAGLSQGLMTHRPFRSPHHTISYAGMVGGGSYPRPGEISLAHHGVLFLDELPEFSRSTLEALRQPLEDGLIHVARSASKASFPTKMIFIAAMNPCPCGFQGHPEKPCRDTSLQIARYKQKISGPLLDRIDMHLEIPAIKYEDFIDSAPLESSQVIRERVIQGQAFLHNVSLKLNDSCQSLMKEAVESHHLSARSHQRILKVARTIAALHSSPTISEDHLLEAFSYRSLNI